MSRRPIKSVADDFSGVWTFLTERGTVPANAPVKMVGFAKRMHRATYSLILWRFRLTRLAEHAKVFIEEIASDALQILPQSLMGYGKTALLLIRGISENALRHIYFSDHPIEFARMNREQKWHLTVDDLFKYPLIHPLILETEAKFDAINRLQSLYSELSASVHGRRVTDLEMRVALNRISFDPNVFERHVKLTERCAEATNFLLSIFHQEQLARFPIDDRQLIMRTMPPGARRVCKGIA